MLKIFKKKIKRRKFSEEIRERENEDKGIKINQGSEIYQDSEVHQDREIYPDEGAIWIYRRESRTTAGAVFSKTFYHLKETVLEEPRVVKENWEKPVYEIPDASFFHSSIKNHQAAYGKGCYEEIHSQKVNFDETQPKFVYTERPTIKYLKADENNGGEPIETGECFSIASGVSHVATHGSSVEQIYDTESLASISYEESPVNNEHMEREEQLVHRPTYRCMAPTRQANAAPKVIMPIIERARSSGHQASDGEYVDADSAVSGQIEYMKSKEHDIIQAFQESNSPMVTMSAHNENVPHSQEDYNYDRVEENKCKICESSPHSRDHEDLHLLEEKKGALMRQNEILRAKIVSTTEIYTQLKEKYKNTKQLQKLEEEGQDCERAIENLGKAPRVKQMNEYYAKNPLLSQCQEQSYGSMKYSEDVLDFYSQRGNAEILAVKYAEKARRKGPSRSGVCVPDSGFGEE